ncbi:hypothetical protein McanMca71_004500 [Microsporum canis]|uniref:Uncharacterized protein n=1 Tax=Arthroderma otae (strain ATCC MYA-4605 / CBS 113480) TaxID=554155 RepID=C5FP72_ARTOC|nr:conserved hypothetical protein [Microsporum canis CBS 113480]EEQ31388.1 conserved hypothetical protein [Microsporum canis CBS 113480]
MPSSSILFPQFFLPLESLKLGRFTISISYPHQDYHDPPCAGVRETIVSSREDFSGSKIGDSRAGFKSTLVSFMSSGISKRLNTEIRITAEQVTTYMLGNSAQWFAEAMSLELTRKWVEMAIDQGDDIYVIVGFHTVSNACISEESVQGKAVSGQIKIPLGLNFAAIGSVLPFANIADPRVAGHHQVIEGRQAQYAVPGEQVCALQFRKVRYRWLSSKANKAFLSKNPRWVCYERSRDEEEGEEDMIEVEMTELDEPDTDWDRGVSSEGDVLLLHPLE